MRDRERVTGTRYESTDIKRYTIGKVRQRPEGGYVHH